MKIKRTIARNLLRNMTITQIVIVIRILFVLVCFTTRVLWCVFFFFSSRRRHTRYWRDWSSDVCSSDLPGGLASSRSIRSTGWSVPYRRTAHPGRGRSATDVGARDAARAGCSQQCQRDLELLAQDRERALDTGLAGNRQRPERRPAQQHAASAERERDRDVQPPPDAAVDPDLDAAAYRVGNLLERVDRRRHAIELPSAVVGDDDGVDAVLEREPGVLGGQDPLEHERQARRPRADRGEVAPAQARRDEIVDRLAAGLQRVGEDEAVAALALAVAEDRQVDRQ